MMKRTAVCLIIIISLLIPSVFALELPEPVIIAKSDSAKYNSVAFDGTTVAWIEYGLNDDNTLSGSIKKFDINSGRQETVIADPSGKFSLEISGDHYVWSDQRGIFYYDESSNMLTFLYSTNKQHSPVIDGNIIVWEEKTRNHSYLRMYDVSTGEYRDVVEESEPGHNYYLPAISGDKLVFIDKNTVTSEISLVFCNLTTKSLTDVSGMPFIYQPPAIDGDVVVWVGRYNDNYSIWMYNISSGEKRPVAPSDEYQMYPDIYGNNIVWGCYGQSGQNVRDGGDIWLYDIATDASEMISPDGEEQDFPRVSENYVVWTDRHGSAHDVYLFNIPGSSDIISYSGRNTGVHSSPTPFPTPDTKVRYYSKISEGKTEWYSLSPSEESDRVSFELRWKNSDDEISLSVVSPGNSIWHFSDEDDLKNDSAIRMTVSGIDSGYYTKGEWTIAVTGDVISDSNSHYDICWY